MIQNLYQTLRSYSSIFFSALALMGGVSAALLVNTLSDRPDLIVALIVVAVLIVFFIERLGYGLAALIMIIGANVSYVLINYHGLPSIMKPLIPFLLAILFIKWLLGHRNPEGWIQPALVVGLYVTVNAFSLLYAPDFSATLDRIIVLVKDALIAITVLLILQRGANLRLTVWAFVVCAAFVGTLNTWQHLTGTFDHLYGGFARAFYGQIVGGTNSYRIGGPFGGPNQFGQVLLILIPFTIDRFINEKKILLRLFAGAAMAVSILAAIFTYSRGAFLGLLLIGFLTVISNIRRPPVIIAVLVGVLLFVVFAPENYFDRISTLTELGGSSAGSRVAEVSLRGRTSENRVAIGMFLDHPILGVGLANYEQNYQTYARPLGLENRSGSREAHNRYLEVAAEQGIFGLAVFGFLLAYSLFRIWRATTTLRRAGQTDYAHMTLAIGISMIGLMLSLLFAHDSFPRPFWLMVGLSMATWQVARHELTNVETEPINYPSLARRLLPQ